MRRGRCWHGDTTAGRPCRWPKPPERDDSRSRDPARGRDSTRSAEKRYSRRVGNTWGRLFRVTTWGESHGAGVGAVVDGCPPRLPLCEADIQPDLDRRVPGQSATVPQRKETDTVRILSGVFEGQTLGTPISLEMSNLDMRPGDYREVMEKFRPSHADYTYEAKYGFRDWRGGGGTSAREKGGRGGPGATRRQVLA